MNRLKFEQIKLATSDSIWCLKTFLFHCSQWCGLNN